MKLSRPPSPWPAGMSVRSICAMQWGIQEVMSAFVREAQNGSVTEWNRVITGASWAGGGGTSTFTISEDTALAPPLSAAAWRTYSPGVEKAAVVTAAAGSAKVTVPGPDTLRQAIVGA